MNKYQEALKDLLMWSTNGYTALEIGSEEHSYLKTTMQELVNRATQKEPISKAVKGCDEEVASHLVCPNCGQPIVNVWRIGDYKPNYCHYCGQALDWSDEE